jgi:hypothetical protein
MFKRKTLIIGGTIALISLAGIGAVVAKVAGHRGGMDGMAQHFCNNSDEMATRMIGRMESEIKPTDTQKPEFEAFKTALTKAQEGLKASCPKDGEVVDTTPPGRLMTMEKHMAGMLNGLQTVRPAFDALYAKLDAKQQAEIAKMPMFGNGHGKGERGSHRMMHKGAGSDQKSE